MTRKCGVPSSGGAFLRKSLTVFVCIVMSICLLPIQGFAATFSTNHYKKTAELTDADRFDPYQKNYQEADKSTDTSFLYKTAEWTNKDTKEAKITLTAHDAFPKKKRSAVYAFNLCEVHEFNKDIAKKNIDFLLKNFEKVDVLRTGLFADETVYTIEDIKSFDDLKWPTKEDAVASGAWWFNENKICRSHRNVGLYDGLRKYLKKRKPTCIYVSFDMFYIGGLTYLPSSSVSKRTSDPDMSVEVSSSDGQQIPNNLEKQVMVHGIPETMDEDCFDVLKRYKEEGRYFSMACDYGGNPITKDGGTYEVGGEPENLVKVHGKLEPLGRERFFYSANIVAALADPTVWPGREAAKKGFWNGEPHNPVDPAKLDTSIARGYNEKVQVFKGIAPDYPYSKDFETMKVPVVKHSLRITDTVADAFEIVAATSEDPKVSIKINGNTVSALLEDYDGKVPMVVTIKVKLRNQKEGTKGAGVWTDTNKDSGKVEHLIDNKTIKVILVKPPKLFVGDDVPERKPPVTPSNPPATLKPPSTPPKHPATPSKPPATPSKPPATPSKPPATPSKPPATPSRPLKLDTSKPTQSKPAPKQVAARSRRLPGTEDKTNLWIWVGIGALGGVGIIGALSMRRRNKENIS